MSERFEKHFIRPAEYVATGLGIATVLLGGWFAASILARGADAIFGWHYNFQSIGDFLGIHDPNDKLLSWDRSFLLLAGAMAAGTLGSWSQAIAEWAQKSPEQREREHESAKRALERRRQLEREKKEAKKAARKPMSGWRRLWMVLSILFGMVAAWIAYESYSRASADIAWHGDSKVFWATAYANPSLRDCDWTTAEAKYPIGDLYTVYCDTRDPFTPALLWAFFPALFMAGIGLTVRWIYRGFRPAEKGKGET